MARTLTTQDVSWFLDLNEKEQLNLDPPYQRRSVWSPKDKRFFIDTIMNNYPAPPVFLHKTLDDNGRPTYHVVDGKQRLKTIIEFSQNRIRIPDDFSDIKLQKKRWKDLDRASRECFWNYALIVEMLPDINEAAIRNTFERINRNSRKLTAQEMRHAKYDGWYISTVEAEAEKQEWKNFGVVTTARAKRMADVQFLSELFAVILRNEILGFDQDSLDELYAEYEDISEVALFVEDDFLSKIERLKSVVREILEACPQSKDFLKVQSHFYTLWGYIALNEDRLAPIDEIAQRYVNFLMDVTQAIFEPSEQVPEGSPDAAAYQRAVRDYAANTRGASTDITPRVKRHKGLIIALHGPEAIAREDS